MGIATENRWKRQVIPNFMGKWEKKNLNGDKFFNFVMNVLSIIVAFLWSIVFRQHLMF